MKKIIMSAVMLSVCLSSRAILITFQRLPEDTALYTVSKIYDRISFNSSDQAVQKDTESYRFASHVNNLILSIDVQTEVKIYCHPSQPDGKTSPTVIKEFIVTESMEDHRIELSPHGRATATDAK